MFFVCGLSFYLGEINSHLLLSLAGSVRCDTAEVGQHLSLLRRKSRAAVLPPSSGAARQ